MAQAMASVAGLNSSSHTVMEGSMQISRLSGGRVAVSRPAFATIRAQQQQQQPAETEAVAQRSRRAVLGLVAAGMASGSFVKEVLADVKTIKVGPPPAPFGGLRKFPCRVSLNYLQQRNEYSVKMIKMAY